MILYHGSSRKLDVLKARQASAADGLSVPEGELLDAIYLTPDRGFAIAIGGMPDGRADIVDEARTITYEHPENFNPDKEVYVYAVDTDQLPEGHLQKIDERQFVVVNIPEVKPVSVETLPASTVEQYYELKNWKRESSESSQPVEHARIW